MNLAQYAAQTRKRADAIPKLVVEDLKDAGDAAIGYTRENLRARFKRRPVALSKSATKTVQIAGAVGELRVRVGDGVNYAEIQEDGGTVSGPRLLIIPLVGWIRTLLRRGGGGALRGLPDTRLQAIRGGSTLLLLRSNPGRGKHSRGARSELLALMVRSAKHAGKHYLRDGFATAVASADRPVYRDGITGGADGLA